MSENYAISLKRSTALLAALTFMAMLTVVNFASFFSNKAGAAQLEERSLTVSSTLLGNVTGDGVQGSETNGSNAIHTFQFDTTATAIQSMRIQYCDDPLDSCTAPTGLSVSAATITSSIGAVSPVVADSNANTKEFSFSTHNTAGTVTVTLTGVTNPTVLGTYFARITTHSTSDPNPGTDDVDYGNVASATTEGIYITARVKETLGFSTGAVTDDHEDVVNGGVVEDTGVCDPITSNGTLTLGDPVENALALDTMYDNYSAFRVYTNALTGLAVTYEGSTLVSGGNDIDAAGAVTPGDGAAETFAVGNEQFGLAVDGVNGGTAAHPIASGTTVDLTHADQAAAWGGAAGELSIGAAYQGGAADAFAFVPNAATPIATSNGYVDCATVPIRYAANIAPLTAPGVYTTTIVYTAVPTW